jgi:serine/threonine-protein kinase RsbW
MFHSEERANGASFRMSAELDNIDLAYGEARRLIAERGLEQGGFPALLVLREALSNAVIHGSGRDAAKTVYCDLSFQGELLTISVEDEGEGFSWRGCQKTPPRPDAEGGRGVCIMQSYSQKMNFNDQGNKVSLDIMCKGMI